MGFSIGSFIGSIAPFVGGLLGGKGGAAIGGAISAGLSSSGGTAVVGRQAAPAPIIIQQPATSVVPVAANIPSFAVGSQRGFGTGGFGVQRRRVGLTGTVARGALGLFSGGVVAGGIVSEILRTARENTGQRVTKNKIIDAARACGIELAADTFGLSETEVCKVIVAGRSRRRRGVSAADVRRTKRTLRFVRSIKKDLKAVRL